MCLSSDDFLFPPHLEQLEAGSARTPSSTSSTAGRTSHTRMVRSTRRARCRASFRSISSMREMSLSKSSRPSVRSVFRARCSNASCYSSRDLRRSGQRPGRARLGADHPACARGQTLRVHRPAKHGDSPARRPVLRRRVPPSGRNVVDFASYVERYIDHPAFVRRMRGRETGVAKLLGILVAQAPSLNGGRRRSARRSWPASQRSSSGCANARRSTSRARARGTRERRRANRRRAASAVARPRLAGRAKFGNWEAVVVDHGSSRPKLWCARTRPGDVSRTRDCPYRTRPARRAT